jgi:hypothetical protein
VEPVLPPFFSLGLALPGCWEACFCFGTAAACSAASAQPIPPSPLPSIPSRLSSSKSNPLISLSSGNSLSFLPFSNNRVFKSRPGRPFSSFDTAPFCDFGCAAQPPQISNNPPRENPYIYGSARVLPSFILLISRRANHDHLYHRTRRRGDNSPIYPAISISQRRPEHASDGRRLLAR